MRGYINKVRIYISLAIVLLASIGLFIIQKNDTLTSIKTSISEVSMNIKKDSLITVKIEKREYIEGFYNSTNDGGLYRNKNGIVRFKITLNNPNDEASEDDYTVKIYKGNNDVSSQFEIDKTVNNITIRLKNSSYTVGQYSVKVKPNGNSNGEKTSNFTIIGDYYNMEHDSYTTPAMPTINAENNTWVEQLILENVNLNQVKINNVTKIDGDYANYDYTDWFSINSYNTNDDSLTIKSKKTVERTIDVCAYAYFWGCENYRIDAPLTVGDYEVELEYTYPNDNGYKNKITTKFTITVFANDIEMNTPVPDSHRLHKTGVSFEVIKLYEKEEQQYFYWQPITVKVPHIIYKDETGTQRDESVEDYNRKYSGIDLDTLHSVSHDEATSISGLTEGNLVVEYVVNNPGVLDLDTTAYKDKVAKIISATFDGSKPIEVKYYFSSNDTHRQETIRTVNVDKFNLAISNDSLSGVDFGEYNIGTSSITKRVNGYKKEYESATKSIRYGGGGKFIFGYGISGITEDDLKRADIKIINTNTNHTVYEKKYDGSSAEPYIDDKDRIRKDAHFDFYMVSFNGNNVIYELDYDGDSTDYIGKYNVVFTFYDRIEKTNGFEIENSDKDYFISSTVDKHITTEDSLDDGNPPGNKKYEYYVGLHMIAGDVDPSYDYNKELVYTKIYDRPIDKDGDDFYTYVEEEYILKILNKSGNNITYLLLNNSDAEHANWIEGGDCTRYTDTLSEFQRKYKDASDLLDYYRFDENGDISNVTNYRAPITRYYVNDSNQNVVDYTDTNGWSRTNIPARNYVDSNGDQNTIVITIQHLVQDANGNIQLGVIRGINRTDSNDKYSIYDIDELYDKTNLFNIVVNDNQRDIDHAIQILPKTEVPPGKYYVYVQYGNSLSGVGYINNGDLFDNNEPIVRADRYPENWLRNTHMTTIDYDDPKYTINIDNPIYSNSKDNYDKAYYNAESYITFDVEASYIYNYRDISFNIQKCTSESNGNCTNWANVGSNDGFSKTFYSLRNPIDMSTIFYQESSEPWDKTAELENPNIDLYHIVKITTNNVNPGKYRLITSYTNPNNSIGLYTDKSTYFKEFSITDKYYGLIVTSAEDMWFAHNYPVERTIVLEGEGINNVNNIVPKIYFKQIGDDIELIRDGNYYYTMIDGVRKNQFIVSTSSSTIQNNKIQYTFKFQNIVDENSNTYSQTGDYYVSFVYQEDGNNRTRTNVDFQVTADQYFIDYGENEYPRSVENEMSFAKDITTRYIPQSNINNIQYVVYYNDHNNQITRDVSSDNISAGERHFSSIEHENLSCNSDGICTGKVRFIINKNKIDMDGEYYVSYQYGNIGDYFRITEISDMFKWDASLNITGSYTYNIGGNSITENVDEFYKNVDNTSLNVSLTTSLGSYPYQQNINYAVVDGDCGTARNRTCNVINDVYGNMFEVSQQTNQSLVLTPKKQNNEFLIPIGDYRLVLYYSNNDYKIIDFTVKPRFVRITYGDVSLKSTYSSQEVDGIYTNIPGTVSVPVSVQGVGYDVVDRYVLDATNRRTGAFTMNTTSDFIANHRIVLSFDPNSGHLYEGSYKMVLEYVDPDTGMVTKEEKAFNVYGQFFDFIIENVQTNPSYLIINKSGSITLTMRALGISNLFEDNTGEMYTFVRNSTMTYESTGEDVTNSFSINASLRNDSTSTNRFNINISYDADTLRIGTYKFRTYYTINALTIVREETFTIDEASRTITIGDVEIETESPDNRIHSTTYGKIIINYSLNDPNSLNDISVNIVNSENENVNNLFVTTKRINKLEIEVLPARNIPVGDYTVVFTLDGISYYQDIRVYGEYVQELTSELYEIAHGAENTIFVNALTNKQTRYLRVSFISNLKNLHTGYTLYDKNGNDVTYSTNYIGTGMKLVNPDDATYTIILIGDLNQDTNITLGDVAMLFTYVTEPTSVSLNKYQKKAGDIRKQNLYALGDVAKLFSYVTKTISEL